MSWNSQTQTASPPAARRRLRIFTRWRSARALKTCSSSAASASLSAPLPSGGQHWTRGRGVGTRTTISKKLDVLPDWCYGPASNVFDVLSEESSMTEKPHVVAVIGAGPVGLAAAAHLSSQGIEPLVFEAREQVGASIREWGHVRVFSPWEYNLDPVAATMLGGTGWMAPDPDAYPTGAEIVERYLEPLAALPEIAPALHLG